MTIIENVCVIAFVCALRFCFYSFILLKVKTVYVILRCGTHTFVILFLLSFVNIVSVFNRDYSMSVNVLTFVKTVFVSFRVNSYDICFSLCFHIC